MALCASCGLQVVGARALCLHHDAYDDPGQAANNRVICDLVHRGIEPRRLDVAEPDEVTIINLEVE